MDFGLFVLKTTSPRFVRRLKHPIENSHIHLIQFNRPSERPKQMLAILGFRLAR